VTPFFQKRIAVELQKAANHFLRAVSGAYKATPVRSLQAKLGIPLCPFTWMAGRLDFD
jgi:hypothetical protein